MASAFLEKSVRLGTPFQGSPTLMMRQEAFFDGCIPFGMHEVKPSDDLRNSLDQWRDVGAFFFTFQLVVALGKVKYMFAIKDREEFAEALWNIKEDDMIDAVEKPNRYPKIAMEEL